MSDYIWAVTTGIVIGIVGTFLVIVYLSKRQDKKSEGAAIEEWKWIKDHEREIVELVDDMGFDPQSKNYALTFLILGMNFVSSLDSSYSFRRKLYYVTKRRLLSLSRLTGIRFRDTESDQEIDNDSRGRAE